jgi:membrane protease YdiL (CAAX protease family)
METDRIQLKTFLAAGVSILVFEAVGARLGILGTLPAIGIARLIEISCMVFVVLVFEKNLFCIGVYGSGLASAFKKGLLWSIGFGLLAACAALLLFFFGLEPLQLIRMKLPSDAFSLVLFFLVGGVIGPVAEEIFFRGFIFRFFRRWGFVFSLCFSTAVFAALHPMSSGIPIPQIVGGLLFATAFEIEKNLIVPVLLHILGNLAIFSIAFLTS